jgi:Domain of unknown function (DUF4412)
MKRIFALALLANTLQSASAQFQGVLVYEAVFVNKVVTTFSENATMGRIDARTFKMKGGVVDSSTGHNQNTLLYDFIANKQTQLLQKQMVASIGGYTDAFMQRQMHFDVNTVTVAFVGPEKIGKYNCKHFTLTMDKFNRDLWITQDLGIPKLYILPGFLYYTPGNAILPKIIAAGGSGVIVKAVAGPVTSTLIGVQSGGPPASIFKVPPGYTIREMPAMMQ